jgi:hypothetical protein
MSEEKFYDLPKDLSEIIELINVVPNNWNCLEGNLRTTPLMLMEKKVAKKNTLLFKTRASEPILLGERYRDNYNQWHHKPADIIAVYNDHYFPEHIAFDCAGYDNSPRIFTEMKAIVISFLRSGYSGRLCFIRSFEDDDFFSRTGTIEFFMKGRDKRDTNSHRRKTEGYAPSLKIWGPQEELSSINTLVSELKLSQNTLEETILEPMDTLIPGLKQYRDKNK